MIDIAEANPKLFAVVQELVEVSNLRSKIMLMKKYLTVCRIASEEKILLNLVSRQHFVDGSTLYSMQDLVDVKTGILLPYLQRITAVFSDHIHNCVLCKAKGFYCEICKEDDGVILFPFDEDAAICTICEGAFHRQCYKNDEECVRCVRLRAKKAAKEAAKKATTNDE